MRTVTVRDLRNRFARVSRWLDAGETVRIIKRGRPYARVVPETRRTTFVGACPSASGLPADLDEPAGLVWEAGE